MEQDLFNAPSVDTPYEENEVERFSPLSSSSRPNLLEVANKRYDAGRVWVDACTLHHRLKESSDWKIKTIMKRIRETEEPPKGKKNWLRDDLRDAAQATDEWKEYIDLLNEAYRGMLDAINERDAWANAFEAVRTEEVNERSSK